MSASTVFDTVMVANRGEIAVRVLRTLRRLSIRSVAVYSDADRHARHASEADIAVRIGPPPAQESYLHIERILEAALTHGAQAIHPGYGFLAENPAFARACERAGVIFVGPSPRAIELMGNKVQAKATVAAAGVPVVAGRAEPGLTDRELTDAADEIGYPVLVKPSAGGGGKGMQLVERPEDLSRALTTARREARSSFGDDELFVERFVERSRHIEVQVLADRYGTTAHLGERECSLQRRHQKVIEEAPSPLIDEATRERLGGAAVATAQSVHYTGAGTVEFIVPAVHPDQFCFMEMNTRLQVEHPVTEMLTGLDLVEQQLRIAAGERLDVGMVRSEGHAFEARVYAEDPVREFLPTGGRVLTMREPRGEGIRIDSGLLEGEEVGTFYDPLLAKVVAWGPDRVTALDRLSRALEDTAVLGVRTNLSFLRALAAHPGVVAGDLDTGLIERDIATLVGPTEPPGVAYVAYGLSRLAESWPSGPVVDPWEVPSGWRVGQPRALAFAVSAGDLSGPPVAISVTGTPEDARVRIDDGEECSAAIEPHADGFRLTVAGTSRLVLVAGTAQTRAIQLDGRAWSFTEVEATRRTAMAGKADRDVRSPMPGTVIEVQAGEGSPVKAGDGLVVVEAMKMEHLLRAPHDGTVRVFVKPGQAVGMDEVVARVDLDGAEPGEEAEDG